MLAVWDPGIETLIRKVPSDVRLEDGTGYEKRQGWFHGLSRIGSGDPAKRMRSFP
jgi:hypothetical protein